MDKGDQYKRRFVTAFRTSRSIKWWVRDIAHDFGLSDASMMHWLLEMAISRIGQEEGVEQRRACLIEWFGPELATRFDNEVERARAKSKLPE